MSNPKDKKSKFGKYSKSPVLVELGAKIRKLRTTKAHLSQENFALKVGVHRTYLSAVERGEFNMTVMTLLEICRGLDVEISDLLSDIKLADLDA